MLVRKSVTVAMNVEVCEHSCVLVQAAVAVDDKPHNARTSNANAEHRTEDAFMNFSGT